MPDVARNFDEVLETNLTFTIRGETFSLCDVRPEVIAQWEDEQATDTAMAGLENLDRKIKSLLAEGDRERWDELRAREDAPVNLRQIKALVEWIVEVQSDRPTEPPSPSDGGRGRRAATSTERSQ